MDKLVTLLDQIRKDGYYSQDELYETLCITLAQKLDADYVSVWYFNEAKDKLVPQKFYDVEIDNFIVADDLKDCPGYFKEICENVFLNAPDVRNHHALRELVDNYFDVYGIQSLLDYTLHKNLQPIGVVCVETKNKCMRWNDDDICFVRNATTLTTRYITH
ncbi:GAF domain-containing protein [Curvivirga sp.]|uniref:GAF domain-containing protein n=1 Tax=Curvivirga sp. TaxID=2856848 RepID=UPI003B5CB4A9